MKQKTPKVRELDADNQERILGLVEATLEAEDYEYVKDIFEGYAFLTESLQNKKTTLKRLRKQFFGSRSEKTEDVLGKRTDEEGTPPVVENESADSEQPPEAQAASRPKAKGHGRNGADAYHGAERISVKHASLEKGDPCPECEEGTLYELACPGTLVLLTGRPPVDGKVVELQKLRCNLCGKVFTAEAPEELGKEKYDITVPSIVALLKYGSGLPFNRQEDVQGSLGIPLPASTQWDIVHGAAKSLEPAFQELIRQAALGDIVYNDDTGVKILGWLGKRAKGNALNEDPDQIVWNKDGSKRCGMYTTGIVSTCENWRIALFLTGRRHAGENLMDVLAHRADALQPPIQMCDPLSRNMPDELKTIVANCLAHGRRQFVDVVDDFPKEVEHVLEALKKVYKNDAIARKENLSPEARLEFHQAESGPVMENLQQWMTRQVEDRLVEPNSGLGQAISYMLKRWDKFTLFLRKAGAPLDNNICERALKKAILHRKNSLFYKTPNGAHVGDLFMSLIYTCELCGVNPFDYLTELQRHAKELAANPSCWMPWNYRQAIDDVTEPAAALG